MITPDTKDWTWVLTRPCPDCGFDTAGFAREQVGSMVRANAAAWRTVLAPAGAAAAGVAQRPSPSVWSPLEYGCHVRDVFRIYDERLARMLAEDDPQYANWDQDATAISDEYAQQDPAQVAAELEAAAATLADRFDGVTDAQWERPGTRSDGAHFTVESFARYFVHDPIHHLHDVGRD